MGIHSELGVVDSAGTTVEKLSREAPIIQSSFPIKPNSQTTFKIKFDPQSMEIPPFKGKKVEVSYNSDRPDYYESSTSSLRLDNERLDRMSDKPPIRLPHEDKISVPRGCGDAFVARILKEKLEADLKPKINSIDFDDDVFPDDAIHLEMPLPENLGSGTPAPNRQLVGGFAAAAYNAARANHFQHKGA